jgi:hypothetical protein
LSDDYFSQFGANVFDSGGYGLGHYLSVARVVLELIGSAGLIGSISEKRQMFSAA